jgi:hypothetical protein
MSDNDVSSKMTWAELSVLMRETGMISIEGVGRLDGLPTIGASLKIVNAETGEKLPGGLPFSVVLFKDLSQAGYSDVALVATVPAAELNAHLPRDFVDSCNRRHRFVRAYPLDQNSFIVQADLFLRGTTREQLKYTFGVWAAALSQILFDLVTASPDDRPVAAEDLADVAGAADDVVADDWRRPTNTRPFVSRPSMLSNGKAPSRRSKGMLANVLTSRPKPL